ncbi:hypothetical protein QUF70_06110 [Desulfobacterales bacterium HSG17]|nr:hypothetical protein [Desulfobacterales bacterium HSG17]
MSEKENSKSKREGLLKSVITTVLGFTGSSTDNTEDMLVQELFAMLLERLNKSKDDLAAIVGREIGNSLATAIKEPIDVLLSGKQLHITVELKSAQKLKAPKDEGAVQLPVVSKPVKKKKSKKSTKAAK